MDKKIWRIIPNNYLLDTSGTVRVWETGVANLQRSLDEWRRMVGGDEDRQAYYLYCMSKKFCSFFIVSIL